MKKDIHNRNDIIRLVDTFYEKIKTDQVIGFIFNEVANVNWESHLPKMYDFWENVLFFTGNFDGNPMQKHKELHNKCPLSHAHFDHWNEVFRLTVDELFVGEKAEEIKLRAKSISDVIMYKTIQ
ncbi:group III truncated hemoglobin [Flavobacterium sp.]|uniref:group III truncated hemoglobin n=1 Tax=Flavobacterium sp. TaxID=239 RepID=UPI0025BF21B3|nr:group III truncated hemoglobin [Flavobacterium sp.]MBA4153554.1 hemoglobin-like protein [Flavobacterium sp.]